MLNVSTAFGFLVGWFAYHFLMNRAVMMRKCCLDHFATHATCDCTDCAADRAAKGGE